MRAFIAFSAILFCLLSTQPSQAGDIPAGTWRLTRHLVAGESTVRPFVYLRIHADGRSEVSNGVKKLPCRLHLEGGKVEFSDPSALGWHTERLFGEIRGFW